MKRQVYLNSAPNVHMYTSESNPGCINNTINSSNCNCATNIIGVPGAGGGGGIGGVLVTLLGVGGQVLAAVVGKDD